MPRRFTVDEARKLVPVVDPLLRGAVSLKSEFDEAERAMQSIAHKVVMMGGVTVDRDHALATKTRRQEAGSRLQEAIEKIQEIGCQVKDLDMGLIDFPTLVRGAEVLLCWKLGEETISFWHGVDEGFRGRKPIDQDFLDHHSGDAES